MLKTALVRPALALRLMRALRDSPVVALIGPRQCGKTTLVRDPGLLHALLGIDSAAALHAHPKVGASWEGFVLEELIGLAGERNAYYWRTQAGAELDLLPLPLARERLAR